MNWQEKWDRWFLGMAEYVSTASKDPSTKCGAIITRPDRSLVSCGYNGLPRFVSDLDERLNNREIKYQLVCHAERNCLLFARQDLKGFTLYTWPMMPCSVCTGMVIQSGISRVVSFENDNPRWAESFKLSKMMLKEATIELKLYENN